MSLNDNRDWVRLARIIEGMAGKRIPVIGDAIQDQYVFGRVTRICPEAPVPVFVPERAETRPGGAANVSRQLRALGCEPIEVFGANQSIKIRHFVGAQMIGFRIDQDRYSTFGLDDQKAVKAMIAAEKPDVVILSDYGKGWVNRLTVECALPAPWSIVDPKGTNWDKYRDCRVLCPNEQEWEAVDCQQPFATTVVAKHGSKGLAIVEKLPDGSQTADLFPAKAKRVYDVTGAGDTVIAVVGATLAAGGSLPDACRLANLAAGYVVGEIGTAACPRDTLRLLVEEAYAFAS